MMAHLFSLLFPVLREVSSMSRRKHCNLWGTPLLLLAAAGGWLLGEGESAAQSYRNAVLADNPLIYLSFDETAGPTAANAGNLGATHNATAFNNPGFSWAGAINNDPTNRAVRLNGTSEYLHIANSIAAANFADATYTAEMWFKKDTSAADRDPLALHNAAGDGFGVLPETPAAQKLRFLHRSPIANVGGQEINPSNQAYSVDQWHHVAIVNDNNAMRLYLDGNLDSVTNTSSAAINAALFATLGRLTHTIAQRHFDGFIDEVAVYNGALTQAQLQAHINAASAFNAGDVQRTPVLAVNFTGNAPASVEPGFQQFIRPDGTSGTQSESYASPFAAIGPNITVTVENVTAFRNRNNMSGPDGNMGESFVFDEGTLSLRLANLEAGNYETFTYHHDSSFAQSYFDVLLTDANGTNVPVLANILAGTGTLPADIAVALIEFESDGLNDIILQFVEPGLADTNIIPLSGFELNQITAAAVPEPAAIVLWALLALVGLVAGAGVRRKQA
jgi:hypothetical protein